MEVTTSRVPANPLLGCIGDLDGICAKIRKTGKELNPTSCFIENDITHFLCSICLILTTVFSPFLFDA